MEIYCDKFNKCRLEHQMLAPHMRGINEEKLRKLYILLKPIISVDEMKYLLKDFSIEELRSLDYNWDNENNINELINTENIEIVADFICLHKNKYNPSMAEIMSQVPSNIINYVNAFEVIEKPDVNNGLVSYENKFNASRIRTYKINK